MYSHYTTLWILIQTLKKATFVYNTIFSSHNSQALSLLSKSSSQSIQVIFKSTKTWNDRHFGGIEIQIVKYSMEKLIAEKPG